MRTDPDILGDMKMPPDFKYSGIIHRGKPAHEGYDDFKIKHPAMSLGRRAKIFSPFDALKGFSEAVASKDVIYENKKELSDENAAELQRRLSILHNLTYNIRMARNNQVKITVTYYVPCEDQNNFAFGVKGQYKTISGICWKVDSEETQTLQIDKTCISFSDIIGIESDAHIFDNTWEVSEP